jgi:hypothetical protein
MITTAGNGCWFCGVGFLVVWKKLPPPLRLRVCTTGVVHGALTSKKKYKKTEEWPETVRDSTVLHSQTQTNISHCSGLDGADSWLLRCRPLERQSTIRSKAAGVGASRRKVRRPMNPE